MGDETELSPSEAPTEHAHAWALDATYDTAPYSEAPRATTLLLLTYASAATAIIAVLVAVLIFVIYDHHRGATEQPADKAPHTSTAPITQTASPAPPSAVPTVTETVSRPLPVEAAPPNGSSPETQGGTQVFVTCGDGSEGVVGGHTTCLFAENVRRAFYAAGGGDVVAFSPVTGERYEMTCTAGYLATFVDGTKRVATRCIGGDNGSAEVVVW